MTSEVQELAEHLISDILEKIPQIEPKASSFMKLDDGKWWFVHDDEPFGEDYRWVTRIRPITEEELTKLGLKNGNLSEN